MTNALKTTSKWAIQKTAEAASDLIGKEIADKITSVSKNSLKELHSQEIHSKETNNKIPKKDTYVQRKGSKLLMN